MTEPFPFAVLVVVDGWGIAPPGPHNATTGAHPPFIERAFSTYPSGRLSASGEDVGLPEGQMGNSEIGHLNIGAGKIVWQIFTLINRDIRTGAFALNPVLKEFLARAAGAPGTLHLMGLVSDGGVHSHILHLKALLRAAKAAGLPRVWTHAFLDGRDVPPRCAERHLADVEALAGELGLGRLATVQGRYFAMDRDNRWDRTEKGYRLLTQGDGHKAKDGADAIAKARARNEGDEFVEPTALEAAVEGGQGLIKSGDSVLFFNFRPDRARQISHAFLDKSFSRFSREEVSLLQYATMARVDAFDREVAALYKPVEVRECLGSVVADSGAKQLRVAETEKYAHVTYFINGGREQVFPGEERLLVPSPKVATYDLKPEMSAGQIADAVVAGVESGTYRLAIVNFANFDMVGHTGVLEATKRAVLAVDESLRRIAEATLPRGGLLLITADHGNAEVMVQVVDGKEQPHTAHTSNLVPLLAVSGRPLRVADGILADVGPTLLHLLGLPRPPEMTGRTIVDWA
ncbi:MAG TPA: 2,3-bisphosphoglycerate-independent phosphoglycerate mutase [Candidatus Thermoplasmatota archaeon]|nr:2,3-bisphosphoglycerate-independent phosphoglycerate mutase [Candidatus Thermoplasmatota archaeon]